jgi:uridine kinase
MRFSEMDHILCRLGGENNPKDVEKLFLATLKSPLHLALFPPTGQEQHLLEERRNAWVQFSCSNDGTLPRLGVSPFSVWSYPFAIAQSIRSSDGKIFGFAGPPGSGKTTLVSLTAACLRSLDPSIRTITASLDDFYLSKEERDEKGLKWRAQPGTHNVEAVMALIKGVRSGLSYLKVPRFDALTDTQRAAEEFNGPASFLLLEGWFLGKNDDGYGEISQSLDYLTYLNCPLGLAKRRRFERENRLRAINFGRGGLSPKEMRRFWLEILEPGIEKWVIPIQQQAELVIDLSLDGTPLAARKKIG